MARVGIKDLIPLLKSTFKSWIYYAAQILFFGAEFTKAYAPQFGSRIVPAPDAEPVTREARAQQGISRRRGTV